jgi:hypothetical protein
MNIPDYISENLKTAFGVKILKFFVSDADPDPGSGNLFDSEFGIRVEHPGSATLEERMKIKRRKREAANKGK